MQLHYHYKDTIKTDYYRAKNFQSYADDYVLFQAVMILILTTDLITITPH